MNSQKISYHVVPRNHGWAVRGEGKSSDALTTVTQREAIEKAREIARAQGAEIFVHGADGRLAARFVEGAMPTEEYYLADRIAVSQEITHGKPRIAGTRILVGTILDLLAAGKTVDDITSEDYYPDITFEDVMACIAYASSIIRDEKYVPVDTSEITLQRLAPNLETP